MGTKIIILYCLDIILAQFTKFILGYIKTKKINFKLFIEPGGMPSCHSSSSAALSTCIGLGYGFSSPLFAIALFFSIIVMYEATGLRREAGRQAKVLNEIIETIADRKRVPETKLRELLGHTPTEVFLGALMGIVFALAFF